MTNSEPLLRPLPADAHLSPEQIFAFLTDRVTATERDQLEDHLQTCALCTEALEGFAHTDVAATQATLLELNHLIRKRTVRRKKSTLLADIKTWGLATVIIFLLVVSAVLVWHTVQRTPAPRAATTLTARPTVVAQPVQGYEQLQAYLAQQLPQAVKSVPGAARKQGEVILTFTVAPDSTLTDFAVVQSLGSPYDQAAIDAVRNGPAWQAARRQGRVVAQAVTLIIPFK